MAYWMDESSLSDKYGSSRQIDFYADTDEDIASLPTSTTEGAKQGNSDIIHQRVSKGSTCLAIGSGTLYILNSLDEWISV